MRDPYREEHAESMWLVETRSWDVRGGGFRDLCHRDILVCSRTRIDWLLSALDEH